MSVIASKLSNLLSLLFVLPFVGAAMASVFTPVLFLIGAAIGWIPMSWPGVGRCWLGVWIAYMCLATVIGVVAILGSESRHSEVKQEVA